MAIMLVNGICRALFLYIDPLKISGYFAKLGRWSF
jgi:hypothetical protein